MVTARHYDGCREESSRDESGSDQSGVILFPYSYSYFFVGCGVERSRYYMDRVTNMGF
jgi:hypothetical protein